MSIASCIDLDHFVVARSFYLKDATSLKSRPPLHCTTVPVVIVFVLITIAYCQGTKWLLRLLFIVLTAFFSHHTRDAVRRGFWLYPFGTTKAIPYFGYISLTIIIPYIVSLSMNYVQIQKSVNVPITV
ncbi:hypothetical protein RN001_016449 [Aquatica leii]|nr:hypothetical protein RN001_016449 [Aquatica leii]